jgi:hypothetical protein
LPEFKQIVDPAAAADIIDCKLAPTLTVVVQAAFAVIEIKNKITNSTID